jgi:hypothetical protein
MMSESGDVRDELLDSALGTRGLPGAADDLRESLLTRTTGVVRFRRRMSRCGLAAGLITCYLAGIATVWRPAQESRSTSVAANQEQTPSAALPGTVERDDDFARDTGHATMSREESLRRMADFYLFERGDIKSAVRNYKRALDLASAEQLAISPGQDSWLLMALKEARFKEMNHDRSANE